MAHSKTKYSDYYKKNYFYFKGTLDVLRVRLSSTALDVSHKKKNLHLPTHDIYFLNIPQHYIYRSFFVHIKIVLFFGMSNT